MSLSNVWKILTKSAVLHVSLWGRTSSRKNRQTFGTPLGPTSFAQEDSLAFVKGRVLAQTTSDLCDLGLGRVLAERLQKLADGRGGDAVRGAGIEQRKGLAGTRLVVALQGVSSSQTAGINAPASFCVGRGR